MIDMPNLIILFLRTFLETQNQLIKNKKKAGSLARSKKIKVLIPSY